MPRRKIDEMRINVSNKRNSLSLFHIESLKRQRRKYIKTKTENMIGIAAVCILLDSPDRYPKLSKALY